MRKVIFEKIRYQNQKQGKRIFAGVFGKILYLDRMIWAFLSIWKGLGCIRVAQNLRFYYDVLPILLLH